MNRITYYFLSGLLCLGTVSCTESMLEQQVEYELLDYSPVLATDTLAYDDISQECRRLILQLDEPSATVVNPSLRSFNTKEIIQVRPKDGNKLIVTSYSALPVKDIKFYCRMKQVPGLGDRFLLFSLDSIPAFGQFEYTPAFTKGTAVYSVANGKYLSFHHPYIDKEDIEITIETEDELYARLKTIIPAWDISFSSYKDGNWREMSAIYAKEWIVIMTNLTYIISQPEFKHILNNYKTVMGGELYGNGGKDNGVFTAEDYENLFRQLTNPRSFSLGLTEMGGGLGGGNNLGVDHWNFYSHYTSHSGWPLIIHELAHCYGYSHDSNLTYGEKEFGFAEGFLPRLHSYLRRQGNLPYIDPGILDFTNPENKKYWLNGKGIDNRYTTPDNKENQIDAYFKQNPLK